MTGRDRWLSRAEAIAARDAQRGLFCERCGGIVTQSGLHLDELHQDRHPPVPKELTRLEAADVRRRFARETRNQ